MRRRAAQEYRSNGLLRDSAFTADFYTGHLETNSANGHTTLTCDSLYRIAESETDICLMLSKRMGVILVKRDIPQELVRFLRDVNRSTVSNPACGCRPSSAALHSMETPPALRKAAGG